MLPVSLRRPYLFCVKGSLIRLDQANSQRKSVRLPRLETMPLNDLWDLHNQLTRVLALRIEQQKLRVESQLAQLGRRFGGSPNDIPRPRPYPPVAPKFRNPLASSETWSGRGRPPLWVIELLAKGGNLDDCRIQ